MSIHNMYTVDIWWLGSDVVTPHKNSPSSAQQGLGSDDHYILQICAYYNMYLFF